VGRARARRACRRRSIENGYLDVGVDETGIRRFRIFVAQSGDHFDADEFDISLLKRIGQTGLRLGDLLSDPGSPPDVLDRLKVSSIAATSSLRIPSSKGNRHSWP